MLKKIISIALTFALVFSVFAAACVNTSAQIDENGRYVPSCPIEDTNRYYFWMPESWKNEKFGADSAGAYWWGGTDSCGEIGTEGGALWPGYKIQVADEELGIYYLDCPKDVEMIIFNNFLNGGERTETPEGSGDYEYQFSEEQYFATMQTVDTACNYYSETDNDFYDNLLDGEFFALAEEAVTGYDKTFLGNFIDNFFIEEEYGYGISMNFDNMICIPDLTNPIPNPLNGKDTYPTEWYFYYGNGKYGALPNQEMAEELTTEDNPLVFNLNKSVDPATPDEPVKPVETPDYPITDKNEIYFDVAGSGWGNVKSVSCHIWKADGTQTNTGVDWPNWGTKAEICSYDKSTGIATYDLSKTRNTFSKDDGKIYCVIFYANTGMQTYNAIMSGNCIGDTLYVTGKEYENPEDSAMIAIEAAWRNNPDCGPEKKITSTGNIVGNVHPDGETDATMLANFLIAYYDDPAKMDLVPNLMKELNLNAEDVVDAVNDKLEATGNKDADKILKSVANTLGLSVPPLGIYAYELDKAYEDSGLFVEFYDDDKVTGTCELKRYISKDNTGWYYEGNCENVDISNGCNQIIKDGNGNELYHCASSNVPEIIPYGASNTLIVGVKSAISNITFTLNSPEEYNYYYIKNLNHDIVKYNLNYKNIHLDGYTYDGTSKTLGLEFYGYDLNLGKYRYYTLEEGKDYTVTYSNNTNAGTATVTVTGIGNYAGTVTKEFVINKAEQELIANMASTTLDCGTKSQIVAIGEGDIEYTSSDESVATVSNTGVVTAVGEGYTVITIKALGNNNYNPDTTKLIVFVNAPTTEPIKLFGDVDRDGELTVKDATEIQKYIVEIAEFDDEQLRLADVDGDKEITVKDATYIQKKIVEII